jgi:hypothetical protein
MRLIGTLAVVASITLYVSQLFVFTRPEEQIAYGIYGIAWYLVLLSLRRNARHFGWSTKLAAAVVSATGLGLVPHRLRLSGLDDPYILAFMIVHFLATLALLLLRPNKLGR